MAETKIVKTLRFQDSEYDYQINAVALEGYSLEDIKKSINADDINFGSDVWTFYCGTATVNIE